MIGIQRVIARKRVAGGSVDCTGGCGSPTEFDGGDYQTGNASKTEWRAVQFTLSGSKCMTLATTHGYKAGLTSLIMQVETDSSNEPSGTLAHADLTDTVLAADLSASADANDFTWQSVVELSAGTYWLVMKPVGGSWRLFYTYDLGNTPGGGVLYKYSTDSGANWTDETSDRAWDWGLIGCDPS